MSHFHKLFVVVLLLLAADNLAAQTQKQDGFGIEVNAMAGKVFKHSSKFHGPIPPLSTEFELAAIQQTDGRKDWEQRRKYPLWGVGVTYTNYGAKDVYGSAVGIYPILQIPIIRRPNGKIEWTFRLGMGIGYVTKHFEYAPVPDTANNAIATHVNNFSLFSTDLRWHINPHWDAQIGLNFSHISNASWASPNLGVNMYGGHIGLRYYPTTSRPTRIDKIRPHLSNRILIQGRLGLAFNGSGNYGGPAYRTYLGTLYASRRYLSKNKILLGIDYSYHERIYAFLKNNEIHPGEEYSYSWKGAAFLGHEWLFGRGAIIVQVGYYLHEAYLKEDKFYEKLGYNFYLIRRERGALKELYLAALLKTHKAVAELAEFGIGVGF